MAAASASDRRAAIDRIAAPAPRTQGVRSPGAGSGNLQAAALPLHATAGRRAPALSDRGPAPTCRIPGPAHRTCVRQSGQVLCTSRSQSLSQRRRETILRSLRARGRQAFSHFVAHFVEEVLGHGQAVRTAPAGACVPIPKGACESASQPARALVCAYAQQGRRPPGGPAAWGSRLAVHAMRSAHAARLHPTLARLAPHARCRVESTAHSMKSSSPDSGSCGAARSTKMAAWQPSPLT